MSLELAILVYALIAATVGAFTPVRVSVDGASAWMPTLLLVRAFVGALWPIVLPAMAVARIRRRRDEDE